MQVIIPRWRNSLIINSSIVFQSSAIHSTPVYSGKWKNKWSSAFRHPQHPSKNYIRYATRQKRADAKRALKDIFFEGGSSKFNVKNYFPEFFGPLQQNEKQEDHSNNSDWKSSKAKRKRMKRKIRREGFTDDYNARFETIFEAKFGNKWTTWAFRNWNESFFKYSTNEFEWRNRSNWTNYENRKRENSEDIDSDDETCAIGSSSERKILGLPLEGPLKIEDVKKAFHLSALKWHPDKHQSSSQAMAEEKFKHCVNAYKSLCDALT